MSTRISIPCNNPDCEGPAVLSYNYLYDDKVSWYCHCTACRRFSTMQHGDEQSALQNFFDIQGLSLVIVLHEWDL